MGSRDSERLSRRLVEIVVEVVGALVGESEEGELLARIAVRSRPLLGADDMGIVLVRERGEVSVAAVTSQAPGLLAMLAGTQVDGPCVDACAAGVAVRGDVADAAVRWPVWSTAAGAAGCGCVLAVPLMYAGACLGCFLAFAAAPGAFGDLETDALQTLANVASIVVQSRREHDRTRSLAEQLQRALDSRVVIEQAKGMLAERQGVDLATAFVLLRGHARNHGQRLHDVAQAVIDGQLRTIAPGSTASP